MAKKPHRVKDTSKTYSRVDGKKVAKALGATIASELRDVDGRGREYFKFVLFTKDRPKTKRVYKLSNKDLAKYKLLCDVEGQFFFHCIYMGRNIKDFHNRVCGYQILKPTHKDMKMRVVFYEKA